MTKTEAAKAYTKGAGICAKSGNGYISSGPRIPNCTYFSSKLATGSGEQAEDTSSTRLRGAEEEAAARLAMVSVADNKNHHSKRAVVDAGERKGGRHQHTGAVAGSGSTTDSPARRTGELLRRRCGRVSSHAMMRDRRGGPDEREGIGDRRDWAGRRCSSPDFNHAWKMKNSAERLCKGTQMG